MSDAVAELTRLLREAGAVPTLDMRRHSRNARSWPDCLPPMFPHAELEVEHWVPDPAGCACHPPRRYVLVRLRP